MSVLETLVPLRAALPGDVQSKVQTVIDWVTDIALLLCGVGIIVAGAMMAISARRGEGGEHAARLGWVMAGCIIIGAAAAITKAISG